MVLKLFKAVQGYDPSIYLFIHFKYLFIYFAPQISRLRLQYEEKMKGLMPASLREVKFYCLCLLMGKLPSRVFVHRKLYSFSLRDIPLHATCSDRPNWGPKGRKKKILRLGLPLSQGLMLWSFFKFSQLIQWGNAHKFSKLISIQILEVKGLMIIFNRGWLALTLNSWASEL